jgi:acyl dehydratase
MFEWYLEDFPVGQTFGSGRLTIDEEHIKSFAAVGNLLVPSRPTSKAA